MIGRLHGKAVDVHGEPPEVAADPGPAKRAQRRAFLFFHGMVPMMVLLSDSLAQAQVTQVGSLEDVLLPAQELGFGLPLGVRTQTLPEVGLDATQLRHR